MIDFYSLTALKHNQTISLFMAIQAIFLERDLLIFMSDMCMKYMQSSKEVFVVLWLGMICSNLCLGNASRLPAGTHVQKSVTANPSE